jgi:hypothetical protein
LLIKQKSTVLSTDLYQTEDVTPFSESLGKMLDVLIATVAVAYNCPRTFSMLVLIFQQVLSIESLKNYVLWPKQLRFNDVTVDECPYSLSHQIHDEHSIVIHDIIIQLHLVGVTSYFNVRKSN